MHRTYLFIVVALGEGGTGLILLVWPSVVLVLLLGVDQVSPETAFFARIAGAALIALSIACWLGRSNRSGSAQRGLVVGLLTYDVAAAVILVYTGLFINLVGIALWPAVIVHAALAVWCVMWLWGRRRDQDVRAGTGLKMMSSEGANE
jgi:hypothetical protein